MKCSTKSVCAILTVVLASTVYGAADLTYYAEEPVFTPISAEAGQLISVSSAVVNQGDTDAPPGFILRYRLSQDIFYDVDDPLIGDIVFPDGLFAGFFATAALNDVACPNVPPGTYYIVWFIDAFDDVFEFDEYNNAFFATNTVEITNASAANAPPLINGKLTSTTVVGSNYYYFVDSQYTELFTTFDAVGLPPGCFIDSLQADPVEGIVPSGLIYGVPEQAGVFNVTITASNAAGTDTAVVTITVNPVGAPDLQVTAIDLSRNPVRIGVDVTFTIQTTQPPPGDPPVFGLIIGQGKVDSGMITTVFGPVIGKNATFAFNAEDTYTVLAAASQDGYTLSFALREFSVTYAPIDPLAENVSKGFVITNPNDQLSLNVPATETILGQDGTMKQVTGSSGGVLSFDIGDGTQASPRVSFDDVETTWVSRRSNLEASASSKNKNGKSAAKFRDATIFVATTTAKDGTGKTRRVRRMIPVSAREAAGSPAAPLAARAGEVDTRSTTAVFDTKMKGKFSFGGKVDGVTLSGKVELPAGMSLSQITELSIGVGNVAGVVTLGPKAKVLSKPAEFKSVKIKLPRVDKNTGVTKAGDVASFTMTLSAVSLDQAGFDTEGIDPRGLTDGVKAPRPIQVAAVIGGMSYFSRIENATFQIKKGVGQLEGILTRRTN